MYNDSFVKIERVDLFVTSSRRQLSTNFIIDLIKVNDHAYLKLRDVKAHDGYLRLAVGGILEMINTK